MSSVDSRPTLQLVAASALSLVIELALIRYLSTEIPAIGFFKNLILIAAFLGLGVGMALELPKAKSYFYFAASALLPALLVSALAAFNLQNLVYTGVSGEAVLVPPAPATAAYGYILISLSFASTVIPLLFLGSIIAGFLNQYSDTLRGYGLNLLGSLAGTLIFSLICAGSTPPALWFLCCSALFIMLVIGERAGLGLARASTIILLSLLLPLLAHTQGNGADTWTPYYKVSLYPMQYSSGTQTGYGLTVNNTWFQRSFDINLLNSPEEQTEDAHAARYLRFIAPMRFAAPRKVLILGAGLGNDTATALHFGAAAVHSVDIDRGIINLSQAFHPNRPYSNERVRVIVDDARHYLTITQEKYDLILFGVLEARSLFSQFANLRLDNYVYTREAISKAKERLNPGGVLWLNMWIPEPWVLNKFVILMQESFGGSFKILHGKDSNHYSLVGCRGCDLSLLSSLVSQLGGIEERDPRMMGAASVSIPTDDWPYIFYQSRSLPASYLFMITLLVVCSLLPIRFVHARPFDIDWGFFLMGAGFLLVTSSSVVRMALVAGTTWAVNTAVFAGILIFALLSAWIVAQSKSIRMAIIFPCLLGTLLLSAIFPFSNLLELPNTAGIGVAAFVLTLPVFFSGIVFSHYFKTVAVPSRALSSNILGAVLGGFSEYLSMLAGNRAMVIGALLIYCAAMAAFKYTKRSGLKPSPVHA